MTYDTASPAPAHPPHGSRRRTTTTAVSSRPTNTEVCDIRDAASIQTPGDTAMISAVSRAVSGSAHSRANR